MRKKFNYFNKFTYNCNRMGINYNEKKKIFQVIGHIDTVLCKKCSHDNNNLLIKMYN